MKVLVKKYLQQLAKKEGLTADALVLPDCEVEVEKIRVLMINEVPPADGKDYFYSKAPEPDFLKTTLPLFRDGGVLVDSMADILAKGVYITTAVKVPKEGYDVPGDVIKAHLPILSGEFDLFPDLQAVMLMGDVAKKAFNMICKERTGKNGIPAGSTYKIRKDVYYYDNRIRLFPSYIMTGGNILIEKSKRVMVAEDIRAMAALLSGESGV